MKNVCGQVGVQILQELLPEGRLFEGVKEVLGMEENFLGMGGVLDRWRKLKLKK